MEEDSATSNPGPSGEKGKNAKANSKKAVQKVPSDPGSSNPGPSGENGKDSKFISKPAVKKTSSDPEKIKKKQTVMELVCEAIEATGANRRKGASAQAIKKYILGKEESGPITIRRINLALITGIEKSILSRPKGSINVTGARGFFVLAETKTEKTGKRKTDNKEKQMKKAPAKETTPPEEAGTSSQSKEKFVKKKVNKENLVPKDPKRKVVKKPNTFPIMPTRTSTPMIDKNLEEKNVKKPTRTKRNNDGERKDASDTEIVVKKGRKSLKSYSSDTDIDLVVHKGKPKKKAAAKESAPPEEAGTSAQSREKAVKTVKGKGAKKVLRDKEDAKNATRTKRNNGGERKDSSDTEIVVKKGRQSLKSYSSETDMDLVGLKGKPKKKGATEESTPPEEPGTSSQSKEKAVKKGKLAKKLFIDKEVEKEPTEKPAKRNVRF